MSEVRCQMSERSLHSLSDYSLRSLSDYKEPKAYTSTSDNRRQSEKEQSE